MWKNIPSFIGNSPVLKNTKALLFYQKMQNDETLEHVQNALAQLSLVESQWVETRVKKLDFGQTNMFTCIFKAWFWLDMILYLFFIVSFKHAYSVYMLKWLPCNPVLCYIENIWCIMKRWIRQQKLQTV